MSTPALERRYIMLTPASGSCAGHARLECQRSRCALTIHAAGLPDGPVRALLLGGDANTGAVMDLGLMHRLSARRAALCRSDLAWHGGWHTLVVTEDWPQARVLLWGQLHHTARCTLWQAQQAVAHYLSLPAPDAAVAPPRPSVLQLRRRLST